MSNVSYDLDTSGGLMPLIKALIKPPDEEVSTQKSKKPQHPYYKRPGKGHNRDSCDACGEGGDLICCDRCPASFHLGCYDPPLDENDIPAGLWLCRECAGADAEPASARGSRAVSPADSKSDSEKKTRSLRNRSNSTKKTEEDDKDKDSKDKVKEKEDRELTPMEILVKAAKVMNPRRFELPREMRVPCPFPGTDKENGNGNGKNGNGKNGNGKNGNGLVTVDAWGCVPLPAKSCFVCRGTCKQAPLLACDYCPLLFHQDCLDPPLTALPTGRWMCPNHVEQYIDWKLVNSVSATERVALWERFAAAPDQHAVKVDFIRRARAHRPPFRTKVPVGVRGRVVVPGMVRQHYAAPPPLLPSRREAVRCRQVLKNLQATSDYEASDEDEDASKHVICLNLSCTKHNAQPETKVRRTDLKGASAEDAADDLKAITEPKEEIGSTESDHSDSDLEYESPVKRRRSAPSEADALRAAVDEQLQKLDQSLIRLLAWQRLQQILAGEQRYGPWSRLPLSSEAEASVHASVPRARLARHGFQHVALPSELLSRAERERIARAVWGAAPRPARAPRPAPPPPGAELRAAACPVLRPSRSGLGDGLGKPIPMRLSRLTFGSDSGNDVILDASQCRYVSKLHATVFYDEVTRHFELINYSEWGSLVDGVLYTADVSPRPAPPPPPGTADEAEARAAAVRGLVRRRVRARGASDAVLCGAAADVPCPPCRCPPPRAAAPAAWEGSALVPHGALLQFGCLMFVFSVADPRPFPYESPTDDPAI